MNAAAKVIHQSNFFSGQFADIRISITSWMQLVLMFIVLASALAVVYTTNLHRLTFSQLELAEEKSVELQVRWGQLMLEQASLATPARVQQLATDKLNMVFPLEKQAYLLRVR